MKTHRLKRRLSFVLALALFALPLSGSAFVIGTGEDLEALTPAPENSEPIAPNSAPIAQNLEFETYQNVTMIESLSGFDPEGDLLSFRIVKNPARGKLTLSEDQPAQFIYQPYENKKGKDSFTYVAVDSLGNVSAPATVKIKIQKAKTAIRYVDMDAHPAHRAAVRLAELDVLVGQKLAGRYFFQPEQTVSREEFLALTMLAFDQDILSDVSATGFSDDESIAVWAKPSVASALYAGMLTGTLSESGQAVFAPQEEISYGEASILVNRVLKLSNVRVESDNLLPEWLSQPVANLSAVGVVNPDHSMSQALTRGDCAVMLSGALDVLDFRKTVGKFLFFW